MITFNIGNVKKSNFITFPKELVSPYLNYDNLFPRPKKLIQSSASWRLDKIDLLPRTPKEQGRMYPADADLWDRLKPYCEKNKLKTLYVPLTTVVHDIEGSLMREDR